MASSNYEQKAQETFAAARASGWVTFGGYLFFVVGIFHVIDGIAALSKATTTRLRAVREHPVLGRRDPDHRRPRDLRGVRDADGQETGRG